MSLHRYRKAHKMPDASPTSTKEELLGPVQKHFRDQVRLVG
jgi:hypothetical protein